MESVYCIRNKINGAEYIGSACNTKKRWKQHCTELSLGKHCNRYLQRVWKKYGSNAFEFCVLEKVDRNELIKKEQEYIDKRINKLPRSMTYNICPTAGSMIGRKATIETRRKLSQSHMGLIPSQENRENHTKAWENKFKNPYTLIDPNGIKYRNIRSYRNFARLHGLSFPCIRLLIKGEIRHHKGWVLDDVKIKTYSLIGPDRTKYDNIVVLKKFCLDHNLPYKEIHKQIEGTRKSPINGWIAKKNT